MNLVVSINRPYFKPCVVMLDSILNHLPEKQIHLYILEAEKLYPEQYERLKMLAGENNTHIIPLQISAKVSERFPASALSRIFIPFLLPETETKALYLDADILVRKNLLPLYNTQISGHGIAGIVDPSEDRNVFIKDALGLQQEYINSGVLLFNLDYLREKYTCDDVSSALRNFKQITDFVDQDFINDFFRDDICYLDAGANCPPTWNAAESDPTIVHFMGDQKPWKRDYALKYFHEYKKAWDKNFPDDKLRLFNYSICFIKKMFRKVFKK